MMLLAWDFFFNPIVGVALRIAFATELLALLLVHLPLFALELICVSKWSQKWVAQASSNSQSSRRLQIKSTAKKIQRSFREFSIAKHAFNRLRGSLY